MSTNYHRNWRSAIAPIIRIHYNFKCVLCNELSSTHHVHHIDGNTNNNAFVNLIPVCVGCHNSVHSIFKTFQYVIPDLGDPGTRKTIELLRIANYT